MMFVYLKDLMLHSDFLFFVLSQDFEFFHVYMYPFLVVALSYVPALYD